MWFGKFDKLLLVFFTILVLIIVVSATVLNSGEIPNDIAFHPLQLISIGNGSLTSVDTDEDGVIDMAEMVFCDGTYKEVENCSGLGGGPGDPLVVKSVELKIDEMNTMTMISNTGNLEVEDTLANIATVDSYVGPGEDKWGATCNFANGWVATSCVYSEAGGLAGMLDLDLFIKDNGCKTDNDERTGDSLVQLRCAKISGNVVGGGDSLPTCANGQIIEYNGSNWVCGNDDVGTGGAGESGEQLFLVYINSVEWVSGETSINPDWGDVVLNKNNYFNITTDQFVVPSDGLYFFSGDGSSSLFIDLYVNGAEYSRTHYTNSWILELNENDTVELYMHNPNVAAAATTIGRDESGGWFAGSKIGGSGTTENINIQQGWDYTYEATPIDSLPDFKTVTFDTAFSNVPIVVATELGCSNGVPTSIQDIGFDNCASDNQLSNGIEVDNITTTGFRIVGRHYADEYVGYSWIATDGSTNVGMGGGSPLVLKSVDLKVDEDPGGNEVVAMVSNTGNLDPEDTVDNIATVDQYNGGVPNHTWGARCNVNNGWIATSCAYANAEMTDPSDFDLRTSFNGCTTDDEERTGNASVQLRCAKIEGNVVGGGDSLPTCASGEIIEYNGSNWVCGNDDVGTVGTILPTCLNGEYLKMGVAGWECEAPQNISQLFVQSITLWGLSCCKVEANSNCLPVMSGVSQPNCGSGGDSENWVLAHIIAEIDNEAGGERIGNCPYLDAAGVSVVSPNIYENNSSFIGCIGDASSIKSICHRACQDAGIMQMYGINRTFATGFATENSPYSLSGSIECACVGYS